VDANWTVPAASRGIAHASKPARTAACRRFSWRRLVGLGLLSEMCCCSYVLLPSLRGTGAKNDAGWHSYFHRLRIALIFIRSRFHLFGGFLDASPRAQPSAEERLALRNRKLNRILDIANIAVQEPACFLSRSRVDQGLPLGRSEVFGLLQRQTGRIPARACSSV